MKKYENNFFLFLKEIKEIKPISNDETINLIKEFQSSYDNKCLNNIILGNIRFVISRAIRFSTPNISASDLIFPGVKGVKHAVIKFDTVRPVKFLTYASYWIEMYMRREVIMHYSMVKITPRYWEMSSKVLKLKNNGDSNRQILRKLNIKRRTLYNVRSLRNDISLNKLLTDSPESSELSKLILINKITPADIYSKKDLKDFLMNQLDYLTPREKNILIRRYGLGETKKHTLTQLSSIHNITAERVRQVIIMSLNKLRKRINKEKI
jgi:RNA polymerase sigma factor (sigma-70 family)